MDGSEVVSLMRRLRFTPGRFLALNSVRSRKSSRAIMRLEGLSKLEEGGGKKKGKKKKKKGIH
jgi:hypothetical protein